MIELKHITKRFPTAEGEFTALKDVSLTIGDGDIFGIVGMSGAGKSTLVRCLNLLERPSEGQVVIDGEDLCAMSQKELTRRRRSISMIFQHFNLLMQRTCLDNICFPMEIAGKKGPEVKKKARELLDIVGLPDKADAYPAQLSGGQKQRIAIARGPQNSAVRRGHLRPGPQDHPGHFAPHPGYQPPSGYHRGHHHPRDGGH